MIDGRKPVATRLLAPARRLVLLRPIGSTRVSHHEARPIDRALFFFWLDFAGDADITTDLCLPHRRAPSRFNRCMAVGCATAFAAIFPPRFPKSNFAIAIFSLVAIPASAFR